MPTAPDGAHPAFDTGKLRARWAREREEAREAAERLAERVRCVVPPVLRVHGVERAYLFGSVAEGRAHRCSDVDLLVLGVGPALYWDLRRELEEAIGRTLDPFTEDDDPVFVAKVMDRGQPIDV